VEQSRKTQGEILSVLELGSVHENESKKKKPKRRQMVERKMFDKEGRLGRR